MSRNAAEYYLQTGVSDTATFYLPEPPTINMMLEMARKKTRKGPGGVWLRTQQSVYWVEQQDYFAAVKAGMVGVADIAFHGALPLPKWRLVSAEYRLRNKRDEVELMAGLKWPVDALVKHGIVEDDGPNYLAPLADFPPKVTQKVARANRGLTLTISRSLLSITPIPQP